jgi:hypothetical protein
MYEIILQEQCLFPEAVNMRLIRAEKIQFQIFRESGAGKIGTAIAFFSFGDRELINWATCFLSFILYISRFSGKP